MNKEYLKPKYDKCPTCGCNTRVLCNEEGTGCYEAVDIKALREENEKVRKERDKWEVSSRKLWHMAHPIELNEVLQSRLSDLVAAAEPFMKELKSLNEWCIHDDLRINFSICTVGDLRTLSAAVDRAREGK